MIGNAFTNYLVMGMVPWYHCSSGILRVTCGLKMLVAPSYQLDCREVIGQGGDGLRLHCGTVQDPASACLAHGGSMGGHGACSLCRAGRSVGGHAARTGTMAPQYSPQLNRGWGGDGQSRLAAARYLCKPPNPQAAHTCSVQAVKQDRSAAAGKQTCQAKQGHRQRHWQLH